MNLLTFILDTIFINNSATILCSLLFILAVLWLHLRRPSKVPPGPPAFIPVLGNLAEFSEENFLLKLKECRRKYGDVFSLKMGSKLMVVLNGHETIKEALVKHGDAFSSRPDLFIFRETSEGQGIVGSSGDLWKDHRTFALSTLRSFGFGKRNLESKVMEEVSRLLKAFEDTDGAPYDISHVLHTSVANIVNAIVFGQGFEYNDPKFMELLQIFQENFKAAGVAGPLTFLPFLKHLPGDPFGAKQVARNSRHVEEFLYAMIKEHIDSYDESNIRDFIDVFVQEMRKRQSDNNPDNTFTEIQLMKTIGDLFSAGTETTATAIRWAVLFFLYHPKVQERMREEMSNVIGSSKFPNMENRKDLPYCEAVVTEVLRCSNIVPLSVPHGVTCDTYFRGYFIPKDTIIVPNLDSVLHDPEMFPDPEEFRPDRFINDQGEFVNNEALIPFSSGRRICLGESLARLELFLFLTCMVQRFQFLPEVDTPLPSRKGILGITRSPKSYLCRIVHIQ